MEAGIYPIYLCIAIPLFFICFLIEAKTRNIIIFYIIGTFQYLVFSEFSEWLFKNVFSEKTDIEYFYLFVEPFLFIASLLIPFALYIISTSDKINSRLNVSIALASGFATIQSIVFSQYDEMNYFYIISDIVMLSLWHIMCMLIINKCIAYAVGKDKNIIKAIGFIILLLIFEVTCIIAMEHDKYITLSSILIITYIPIVLKYYMDLKKARIAKRHR